MNGPIRALRDDRWDRNKQCDEPWLARIERYIELGAPDLNRLRSLIDLELTVEKRRDLVVEGCEFRKLCFVKDGFAARYKMLRNGRRQIVNLLLPGDVVGLSDCFPDCAAFSVVALTDMKLRVCSLDAYADLCYHRPKFGLVLSWLMAEDALGCAEHVADAGRRTPVERIVRFLLGIHSRLRIVRRAGERGFDIPFSQEVMSDALGLSVPHLNRTLAKLRRDGLISVSGRRLDFSDMKSAQVLAQFQPLMPARIPPHYRY